MATDMFLKLNGIEGECKDAKHRNEMDIESFTWGVAQSVSYTPGTGSGMGTGKAEVTAISITKHVDKASPKLWESCLKGRHIFDGVITARKAGGDSPMPFLKIELEDVIVSGVQNAGHDGDLLLEILNLYVGKFSYRYTEQDASGRAKGNVEIEWDLRVNSSRR